MLRLNITVRQFTNTTIALLQIPGLVAQCRGFVLKSKRDDSYWVDCSHSTHRDNKFYRQLRFEQPVHEAINQSVTEMIKKGVGRASIVQIDNGKWAFDKEVKQERLLTNSLDAVRQSQSQAPQQSSQESEEDEGQAAEELV